MCNDLFMRSLKLLHLCDALKTRCYAILSQERLLRSSCISSMHSKLAATHLFPQDTDDAVCCICSMHSKPAATSQGIALYSTSKVASARCTQCPLLHRNRLTCLFALLLHLSDALNARCYLTHFEEVCRRKLCRCICPMHLKPAATQRNYNSFVLSKQQAAFR